MLTKDTIYAINDYDKELEKVFEIYMPENYNQHLEFKWEEIKALQKRLPIICFFRFLFEAEVIPHCISPAHFIELITKMKTPLLPNTSSNKEAMFYTSETMTNYLRDFAHLPEIKLLEGDGGLTFLEMQLVLIRISCENSKDSKNEFAANFRKLAQYIQIKQAFDDNVPRKNKFGEIAKAYLKKTGNKAEKIVVKKRQSRKKIEDLYDSKDVELREEASRNVYRNMKVEFKELDTIRRDLDLELPTMQPKKKIDKENSGFFDV